MLLQHALAPNDVILIVRAANVPSLAQVSLPAQLAVDLLHCERAAQSAVAESNGQVRLVQGELITVEYFNNLAAEVDEILQVRDLM